MVEKVKVVDQEGDSAEIVPIGRFRGSLTLGGTKFVVLDVEEIS